MPDHAIVKVSDVQTAVGPKLDVDGAEPRVLARDEILHGRLGCRAGPIQAIHVDPIEDDVSEEELAEVFLWILVGRIIGDAAQSSRMVLESVHVRSEAEPVVLVREMLIESAADQHRQRPAVAIAGVEVAVGIERQAEGIHLPVRVMFDARAVGLDAIGVARGIEIDVRRSCF